MDVFGELGEIYFLGGKKYQKNKKLAFLWIFHFLNIKLFPPIPPTEKYAPLHLNRGTPRYTYTVHRDPWHTYSLSWTNLEGPTPDAGFQRPLTIVFRDPDNRYQRPLTSTFRDHIHGETHGKGRTLTSILLFSDPLNPYLWTLNSTSGTPESEFKFLSISC